MVSDSAQFRLLAASSLLSSRWSRDNLLTPDPARLYAGVVSERIGVERLEELLRELTVRLGAFEVTTGALGVLSWGIRCRGTTGDFVLQLPLVRDSEGIGGRSKQRVPERCFENARYFAEQGLDRYLLEAERLFDLPAGHKGASFLLPPGYFPLTFGLGAARVDFDDAAGSWVVSLGRRATADITSELVAALAYHYDPDTGGGTAIVDVLINDGDFLIKRESDGTRSLRMMCARRLERGVDKNRFLLFLVQLMAYEDWSLDDDLIGLPVLVGHPLAAFVGFVRGTGLRYRDLGRGEATGQDLAREWIAAFGRSREGRAYRPWVESFLKGSLSLDEVDEPRRPWWNLVQLEQRRDLARLLHGAQAASALSELVTHLEDVVGVGAVGEGLEPGVNDWNRDDVMALLNRCGVAQASQQAALSAWFSGWPYRNRRQLKNSVTELRAAGEHLGTLRFHGVAPSEQEGTLPALSQLPAKRPMRALANPEVFGDVEVPAGLEREVARRFPSFEAFMDDALHHPDWGYYAHRVTIGEGGHFSTNPEALTPHYGRWVAAWAIEVWSQLVAAGQLGPLDPFPLIEFGAGNGRLARDVLDSVRAKSAKDSRWQAFSEVLDYRIYELSESLRRKQQELVGREARVVPGDARCPALALGRDFPSGVRGFIVSNELPDAFGVHKVVFSRTGTAEAVVVVPRIEEVVRDRLPEALGHACLKTDSEVRSRFGWQQYPGETLLDRETFTRVMTFIYALPNAETQSLLGGVWCDEVRVPASAFEALSEVLHGGADQYSRALAQEASGVVQYVNVHAAGYIKDLAQVLRAGQIMTIDYGDTTWGLVHGARRGKFPFRIYCDEGDYRPRPNHPYTWPGAQDLTADVNFTDLALAGLRSDLELTYYGPERAITGSELSQVLRSTDQKPFARFVGNSVFKILVLGRGASYCPTGAGLEPFPLFSDQADLDDEQKQRAVSIAERLVLGSQGTHGHARVHLRVVNDHGSGEQHLELVAPVFKEDWQNRITFATANTAFASLRQERSAAAIGALGSNVMQGTSTLVEGLLSRAPAGALACRPGCAHCCHQSVGVTVPEALAIARHLLATRTTVELQSLQQRVARAQHETRGLTRDQRNSPEHPCPFLNDDLCSIYQVRPLSCRGVHSLDEQACKSKLHDRERRAAYERGELPGHAFAEPVRAVLAMSAGLQLGLHEGLGLDMRPLDLTSAMRLLLSDALVQAESSEADTLLASERVAQWLDGAPAFAEARGGDATDHAGQVELSGAVAFSSPERPARKDDP